MYNYGNVEQFFKENVQQNVDEGKLFFNKKINLIYGKILRKIFTKLILRSWLINSPLTSLKPIMLKSQEDAGCKKTIANINFGLLEK